MELLKRVFYISALKIVIYKYINGEISDLQAFLKSCTVRKPTYNILKVFIDLLLNLSCDRKWTLFFVLHE